VIIPENLALKKSLSHLNINEKYLHMLIKSSRKSHDKKQIYYDQNNASISTSPSSFVAHPRLSINIPTRTFKNKTWRKTNMKRPKTRWVPKVKVLSLADKLNPSKKTQILKLKKWMLTVHKGKKVYIPIIGRQETKRQQKK